MRYFVTIDGTEHTLDVALLPGGDYDVRLVRPGQGESSEEQSIPLETHVSARAGQLTVNVEGQVFDMVLEGEMPTVEVYASGRRGTIGVESARLRAAGAVAKKGGGNAGTIVSPMPGKVVKLLVTEGQVVEQGQPIVVVEAMKMENELSAEVAGAVKKVHVAEGDTVEGGGLLVTIA